VNWRTAPEDIILDGSTLGSSATAAGNGIQVNGGGGHKPYHDITGNHWAYAEIIEASIAHDYTRDDSTAEIWQAW